MRGWKHLRRAITVLAISLLIGSAIPAARAQGNCMTFGQARQAGLFARLKLRPAAAIKNEVEARTGGKVVSFLICRPGPVYKLTVLRPGGNVTTVTVPAQ